MILVHFYTLSYKDEDHISLQENSKWCTLLCTGKSALGHIVVDKYTWFSNKRHYDARARAVCQQCLAKITDLDYINMTEL